jgi:hypothetical protein
MQIVSGEGLPKNDGALGANFDALGALSGGTDSRPKRQNKAVGIGELTDPNESAAGDLGVSKWVTARTSRSIAWRQNRVTRLGRRLWIVEGEVESPALFASQSRADDQIRDHG